MGENGEGTVGQDQIKGAKRESGEREDTKEGGDSASRRVNARETCLRPLGPPRSSVRSTHIHCVQELSRVLGGEAQNLSTSPPCPPGVSSLCGEVCKAEFQRSEVPMVEDIFKQRRRA